MEERVFPTKGNLLNMQKSLALAQVGYELLDKKRNILIRELMGMVEKAKQLCEIVDTTYKEAYQALQMANITNGIVQNIAGGMPEENGLSLSFHSVMGCELPKLSIEKREINLDYGFMTTDSNVDKAYICFEKVKEVTVTLAEVESSIYRLSNAIRKTQTRANALQNIVIPRYKSVVKYISDSLEEKEREEFSRMKVIKAQKTTRKKYIGKKVIDN